MDPKLYQNNLHCTSYNFLGFREDSHNYERFKGAVQRFDVSVQEFFIRNDSILKTRSVLGFSDIKNQEN